MVEELPPIFGFAHCNIDRDKNIPQIRLDRQTSGSQRRRLVEIVSFMEVTRHIRKAMEGEIFVHRPT